MEIAGPGMTAGIGKAALAGGARSVGASPAVDVGGAGLLAATAGSGATAVPAAGLPGAVGGCDVGPVTDHRISPPTTVVATLSQMRRIANSLRKNL